MVDIEVKKKQGMLCARNIAVKAKHGEEQKN